MCRDFSQFVLINQCFTFNVVPRNLKISKMAVILETLEHIENEPNVDVLNQIVLKSHDYL